MDQNLNFPIRNDHDLLALLVEKMRNLNGLLRKSHPPTFNMPNCFWRDFEAAVELAGTEDGRAALLSGRRILDICKAIPGQHESCEDALETLRFALQAVICKVVALADGLGYKDQVERCDLSTTRLWKGELDADKLKAFIVLAKDRANAEASRGEGETDPGDLKGMTAEAKALAMLVDHPDWTNKRIAQAIGCHAKSLSRMKKFTAARKIQQGEGGIPRGRKDADGNMEAYDE